MRRFSIIAATAAVVIGGAVLLCAEEPEVVTLPLSVKTLSAEMLQAALRGDMITDRAMQREGEGAIAFAEGYIAGLSVQADRAGIWCGSDKILPHEVAARIYDYIETLGDEAVQIPADRAVTDALVKLSPCSEPET